MKKLTKILCVSALLTCFALAMLCAASAANVAFLKTGSKGDGSSPQSPVGTLTDALNSLDLDREATVVICGEFIQGKSNFYYKEEFDGKIIITSVYDGVDYRETAGAQFICGMPEGGDGRRFICSGEYVFRDLTFHMRSQLYMIVANHYPVTIDTGVKMICDSPKTNGQLFDTSFSILGGYQDNQAIIAKGPQPEKSGGDPTSITVRSGENILIAPYSRGIQSPDYYGVAEITVEGDAKVGTLYYEPVNGQSLGNSNVNITVGGNAQIQKITCGDKPAALKQLTLNWNGGKIGNFIRNAASAQSPFTLNADASLASSIEYAVIEQSFNTKNVIGDAPAPAETKTEVKLTIGSTTAYVNGQAQTLDVAPVIENSRTLMPLRFIAEAMGASVEWDGATGTATLTEGTNVVVITLGSTTATVGGATVTLDVPAASRNGRTLLPVRFIAESFGATVAWDGATSTATLTT
ncbi:MAG: copper amine oxidase N-terminal domain-containing protein [Clostridia bacterium]|nr:copper amine oxidase N-terminal domain-containing protein [Clostridia bacterium]